MLATPSVGSQMDYIEVTEGDQGEEKQRSPVLSLPNL